MGEVVNLRRARKAKARAGAAAVAETNRARFGHTKGAVKVEAMEAERLARVVDGAKLEPSGEG